ncbi:MAG: hypothetical protein ACP5N9_05780 [Candidatus Bilamarchaeum sp.]|jgi:hypothetical protein
MGKQNLGEMAFLGGIALAIILGLASSMLPPMVLPILWGVLAVLGIVVGLMNVNDKEVVSFLVATIAMSQLSTALKPVTDIVSTWPAGGFAVLVISGFLSSIGVFVAPAAFVVAIKAVWKMAKDD